MSGSINAVTHFEHVSHLVGHHLGLAGTSPHSFVKTFKPIKYGCSNTHPHLSYTTNFILQYPVQSAIRKHDGKAVLLKKVDTDTYTTECDIANYFSSKQLADIPENHCVPIYETLHVSGENTAILVMPLLRKCMDPPFETVGEVIDFLGQVFEVRSATST